MNENYGEIEIDIRDLLSVVLKRWWLILIATILGGIILFGYASVTYVPTYKSTAKMYVNNISSDSSGNKVNTSPNDINASKALVNTYCEIIRSRRTLETVIDEAGLDYSYNEPLSMLSCGSVNETEVFYISIVSEDRYEAKEIVNTIVKVLPDKITGILEGSSVRTVDPADGGVLLSSGIAFKTAIGAAVAMLLACAFFFVYDVIINDTLHTDEWITDTYDEDIPLLAVIPDVNYSSSKRYGNNKYYKKNYESVTESSKVK